MASCYEHECLYWIPGEIVAPELPMDDAGGEVVRVQAPFTIKLGDKDKYNTSGQNMENLYLTYDDPDLDLYINGDNLMANSPNDVPIHIDDRGHAILTY